MRPATLYTPQHADRVAEHNFLLLQTSKDDQFVKIRHILENQIDFTQGQQGRPLRIRHRRSKSHGGGAGGRLAPASAAKPQHQQAHGSTTRKQHVLSKTQGGKWANSKIE